MRKGMKEMSNKKVKITKEIMEKVVMLDCRKDENVRRLNKSLMKLPLIKSEECLETDNLEKLILKIEKKYPVYMSYMMRYYMDDEVFVYTSMIKTKDRKHDWLISITGKSINEVLKKVVFYMYYYIEMKKEKKKKNGG
jgi:hypothetical protein